jgi:carbonic anhydrase
MDIKETFFTRVGCMDGRVQSPLRAFGQKKFDAEFPDTITGAGEVGILAHHPNPEELERLQHELKISIERHDSKGILVHGHQECAGNPVDDKIHMDDVKKSVEIIKKLINNSVPVIAVFVIRSKENPRVWEVVEI